MGRTHVPSSVMLPSLRAERIKNMTKTNKHAGFLNESMKSVKSGTTRDLAPRPPRPKGPGQTCARGEQGDKMFKRILVAFDESPAIRTRTTHRHPSRQELKCRVEGSVGASASLSRRITEAPLLHLEFCHIACILLASFRLHIYSNVFKEFWNTTGLSQ
jgi:hypothetical protein